MIKHTNQEKRKIMSNWGGKDEIVSFYNNDDDFLNLEEWGENLFAFLSSGEELEIQDILNNCEVIENEKI